MGMSKSIPLSRTQALPLFVESGLGGCFGVTKANFSLYNLVMSDVIAPWLISAKAPPPKLRRKPCRRENRRIVRADGTSDNYISFQSIDMPVLEISHDSVKLNEAL